MTTAMHTNEAVSLKTLEVTRHGVVVHGRPDIYDYIARFQELAAAHDAVQWCIGDMVVIGDVYFHQEWYQAVAHTGYTEPYLNMLANTCRVFEYEERLFMRRGIKGHQPELIPFTFYRLLSPGWIPHQERLRLLREAGRQDWGREDIEVHKRELWTQLYGDLPYAPVNTRDPDAALAAWEAGGREDAIVAQEFGHFTPAKKLKVIHAAFTGYLERLQHNSSVPPEVWRQLNLFRVRYEELIEGLKE